MSPPQSPSPLPALLLLLLLLLFVFAALVSAQVPPSRTFRYHLNRPLETEKGEYDSRLRTVVGPGGKPVYTYPFCLCFYNSTPDSAVLALAAGVPNGLSPVKYVWEANRNSPVHEGAVLFLAREGNLLLADGRRVVWESGTENKGVTGMKLLPNGNLVLHDKNGRFVWQSFDHPTDTLVVGQSLRLNSPNNNLTSRSSDTDSSNGAYSIVLDKKGFGAYINNKNLSDSGPLQYGGWEGSDFGSRITFKAVTEYDKRTASELVLAVNQDHKPPQPGRRLLQIPPTRDKNHHVLNKLSYNATYSIFRIGFDGNLRTYTYNDAVSSLRWRESFTFFSDYFVSECQMPTHCGAFGLCQKGMCVACPTPGGLVGWSDKCSPPVLPPCKGGAPGRNGTVNYYKVVGVEHFLRPFVDDKEAGKKVSLGECRGRCTRDCKCAGFIYTQEVSDCLLVPMLGTLLKVDDDTLVAYIKYAK